MLKRVLLNVFFSRLSSAKECKSYFFNHYFLSCTAALPLCNSSLSLTCHRGLLFLVLAWSFLRSKYFNMPTSTRNHGTEAHLAPPELARTARLHPAATSTALPVPPTPSSANEEMPSWFASPFTNLSSQIKGVQEEATAARA